MKKLLKAGLALLMACSLAACGKENGGEEAQKGGTYIIATSGEPNTLNPDTYSDDYNYEIMQNIFSRIVKLNNNYEVLPDLAETWDITDGACTYTFHLTDKATWHDGEKVTAEDAKYTFDTIIAEQYANASVFAYVTEIIAEDDTTLVFKLSQPDASFLSNLAWYGTFVLPKHILEGQDWTESDFNENPVGSGPFKFSAWNKGTDVRIVRNEDYWGDVPYLDEVIYTVIPDANTQYQAWLNNEVDEISSSYIPVSEIASLQESGKYIWVTQEWPSPYYVTFNLNDGPFADADVRMAVAKGVNREEVSTKAFNGYKPANNYYISQIYTDALNEDAKQPDYDPEGAMKLLEDAGYKKDANGYYFETQFTIFAGFEDAATVVIAELDKIGIKCTLNVLDYNIWVEQVWQNQQFTITMVAGFQGPDVLGAGRRWTKAGAVNVNGYSDPEVEDLYAKALKAESQDEINDIMKQIQVILARDNTLVTMVNYADVAAYKSYVHGHPMFTDEQGGSRAKAGFSELTYVWLDEVE
ncbi:MAG: ABC transporter substrate-binding protein [Traorella sp.]